VQAGKVSQRAGDFYRRTWVKLSANLSSVKYAAIWPSASLENLCPIPGRDVETDAFSKIRQEIVAACRGAKHIGGRIDNTVTRRHDD
jgi:hypothetical protein